MNNEKLISAVSFNIRAANLRRLQEAIGLGNLIKKAVLMNDARQIEKALAQAKESAPKTNLKFTLRVAH